MATVFEVQSEDVKGLNDLNLTKLLKMLLHSEARTSGIAERSVEVALNIRVADGGEDGRIQWTGGPDSTDYLPSRFVQFQNKATDMGPTACANEIVASNDDLKPMVEQALNLGGTYILFTTQELNTQQKQERIDAIRQKLQSLNKPYADTANIDVYDATKISTWVNHYPPAITAVLNWVGKPLVNGLCTWEEWESFNENHHFDYVADQSRAEAINYLRDLLIQSKKCARITGLSGLGKTRLALELCRDQNNDGFSKRVVYIDAAYGEPNLAGLVNSWVKLGLDCLFIVDNCDLTLHKQLKREIENPNSLISLLTLHYNPEKDSETDPIQLKKLSDELIKSMLEPVYGEKINDLDRIVGFAQGFPQMAVLLAKARLDQTSDMGSLTDDDLVNKLLWGSDSPDKQTSSVLEACALFDKFGIEQEREEEAKFIAEQIAGTDLDTLYRCIVAYEERGIVNKAGRLAQIIPKPLAIRLAADWWRTTRMKRQTELIETEMPGQLEQSFCDQISKLDFLPEVKELTKNLCGDQGPFGQAEVILSTRGSRLFRSLVEVNPKVTSDVLYKILSKYSNEQLNEISGDVRRNLVWALEKLCFHSEVFEKSARCLLWLASAENEDWANNATGQFLQLFRTFLSGTEAPPEIRLRLIDDALNQDNDTTRELAVQALESAIDTFGGSRTVGAEYQGSGKPLVEWRPKIWKDAFDYWIASLERLTTVTLEGSSISPLAKDAIASNIRGLVQRNREVMLAIDNSIKQIVDSQGPLWPKALDSIKMTLSFDTEKMPKEVLDKLNEWIDLLTPENVEDRISIIVSTPPYEHERDELGHHVDIAALNSKNFAHEFVDDISVLIPHLDDLLTGEQRYGLTFGSELVTASGQWEPLLSITMDMLENMDEVNLSFMMGLLDGLYKIDSETWEEYITTFQKKVSLQKYYTDVIRTGLVTNKHLQATIDLILSNSIEESAARVFIYGSMLDHLDPKTVINFVDLLQKYSFKSAWTALEILSMYCHSDKEKWDSCINEFENIIINLPLDRNNKNQMHVLHHWKEASELILSNNNPDFALNLTKIILSSCNDRIDYGDLYHYIKPIMRILLKEYGGYVWPLIAGAIKDSTPETEYYLNQLLSNEDNFHKRQPSVLADLPENILHEWCRSEPDLAPLFCARSTDVYIEDGDVYTISPRAQFLIDEFGENKKVLDALSSNMGSFGWSGSVVPIYKKEISALEPLRNHKYQLVREWIDRRIEYLNKAVEKESILDAEMEWGVH